MRMSKYSAENTNTLYYHTHFLRLTSNPRNVCALPSPAPKMRLHVRFAFVMRVIVSKYELSNCKNNSKRA